MARVARLSEEMDRHLPSPPPPPPTAVLSVATAHPTLFISHTNVSPRFLILGLQECSRILSFDL